MLKKLLIASIALIAGANATFAANALSNTDWNLVSYNGQDASGTLSFTSDTMYSKFCNNVSQGYTYTHDSISSNGMGISTKMYCDGLPMTLEDNFDISTSGTASIISGDTLTITTNTKHIFTFKKENSDPVMCTMEYAPVCGEVEVQCITAPCLPVKQTFGNTCMANASKATNITAGECNETPILIGGDKDKYGCMIAAGYSWDNDLQQCTQSWNENIITRAFDAGITKYNTKETFMGDSYLTREQATKMLLKNLDAMNVPVWTIKQQAGSCVWKDEDSIDSTLLAYAKLACTKGLLRGSDEGNFMPKKLITTQEMNIILTRIAGFVPSLSDSIAGLGDNQSKSNFTRNEFVKILYTMNTAFHTQQKYITQQKELDTARAVWKSKNITTYNIIQQMSCHCVPDYTRPILYHVVDNIAQTEKLTYSDDNTTVNTGVTMDFYTVETAFDLIENAINKNVAVLNVTYDPTNGYPTSIDIDYDKMIADEEKYYTFTISQ